MTDGPHHADSGLHAGTAVESISVACTFLFVPGDRPDRFAKAAASGADAIVLDLEDAVAPAHKTAARDNVRRWLAGGAPGIARINGVGSPWHEDDVSALCEHASVVMLPKADNPDHIAHLLTRLKPGAQVVPLLETAMGVLNAQAICGVPGVARVAFGNGDLATEFGIDHASHTGLAYARSALVLACAANQLPAPIDGVTTAVHDEAKLFADTRHAADLGYTAKLCIHPRQVAAVHGVFTPSEEDLHRARQVLAAADENSATTLDGQLIDQPLVEHARHVLARARTALR